MTRIETTAAFATNLSQIVLESRGRKGSKHILCADPTTRGHIASALADAERSPLGAGALTTVLPSSVDQVERVVLSVGRALGADVLAEASAQLTQGDGGLDRALNQLSDALRAQSRSLVMVQTAPMEPADGVHNYDIWSALGGRRGRLYRWLDTLGAWFVEYPNDRMPSANTVRPWALRNAPLQLSTRAPLAGEAWARLGEDATALNHHLLSELLQVQPDGHHALGEPLELLGERLIHALELLAAHEGPLSRAVVRRLTLLTPQELEEGLCLSLWLPLGDQLIANPSWAARALARRSASHRQSLHRSLGEAFAREVAPNDPNAHRLGLTLLDAHRHLLRAGEWSRAVEYARFGTALLIDRAQSVSREARSADDYCESARLYEQVAAIHERQPEAAPAQLRAYTIHYLHFNRARAESEPIYETRRGYAQATELWPEHALFWSRLVRTLIYEGRHAEAHTALQDAKQRVPEHPNKLPTLIGRTVGRLLQRGLLLDAAEIWGDYEPTAMADRPIKRQLQDRLQTGWTTDQISFVGGPSLTFTRPVRLVVQLIQAGLWSAAIEGDVARARGPSPVAALRALIARARARCDELLRAFTHTLDAPARMEKQVLFGLVDVVRSGLDAPPPRTISVLGNLRRVEGALALHTVGSRHDVLPLSDAQARAHVASEQLWIAEVRGGPGGLPEGPILRLTPAVEADEEASLLAAWERRLANAD